MPTPYRPDHERPVPLPRGRAFGLLGGLLGFLAGFAVAGVLVLSGHPGEPPYLVAVTVGMVGIGVVGMARRGPVPPGALWSPAVLRLASDAVGLPGLAVCVVFYALAAVGILGNLVVPLTRR